MTDNTCRNKMRILQINVDDVGCGGVFSLVMNIFENIKDNIVFDFCSIEKFQNDSNIERVKQMGGQVYCVGYEGNKLLRQFINFIKVYKLLAKSEYITVHIHSDVSFKLFNYSFAAKLAGVKNIIVHSHSAGIDGTNRCIKLVGHNLFRWLLPFTANHYFACSDLAARWMFIEKIIRSNKVRMINNGIDTNKYSYNDKIRTEYRKKMGLENKFVVGHVGRFNYQKNHEFLIDIFAKIYHKNSEAVLLLIGEGDLKTYIKEKVHKLGISNSVIFYGISDEVYNLLQVMDIFLLPSHFEGLPIVGVEAQAAGLPLVLSDSISKETKLTKSVEYISLDNSPETWALRVLAYQGFNRAVTTPLLQKSGFDIRASVKNLARFYKTLSDNA